MSSSPTKNGSGKTDPPSPSLPDDISNYMIQSAQIEDTAAKMVTQYGDRDTAALQVLNIVDAFRERCHWIQAILWLDVLDVIREPSPQE